MTSEDVGTTARFSAAVTLLVAAALALPPTAAAQSVVAGEMEGTVTSLEGRALGRVEVSLTDAGTGLEWTKLTSGDGSFSFEFVPAGEYHLRVEALGYRPRVVTAIPVGPSERVRMTVTVVPEPPPVTGVDTLRWGRDALLVTEPATGRRVRGGELAHLPARIRDVADIAVLSGLADPWLGLEGLPGRETHLVAEGEPFRAAIHPTASRRELAGMPFPRMGLGAVRVMRGIDDIEWSGASGGLLGLETRAGTGDQPVEVWGLWSGGGLWSSDLRDEVPTSTSIWGGGRVAVPIVPDTSMVSIAVEGARVRTPLIATRGDSLLPSILPRAPDLEELGVEETTWVSGLARMDWNLAAGKHISARAAFSTFRNVSDRPGAPAPGAGVLLPVEGTEASVAGVMSAPILNDLLLEVRGSFGYSSRDHQPDSEFDDLPGAWIVGSRAAVGVDPSFPALVERTDFGLSPVVHWRSGTSRLKGGLRLDHSTHEIRHAAGSPGAYFYGTAADLQDGEGAFSRTVGAIPSSGFSVTRAGAFAQYRWTAAPDLDLTTGVRYEAEFLPRGDVRQATDWATLTGIANDAFPDRLNKLDARLHLKWDLTSDGRTWLEGGLGLQNGEVDPAVLGEALTLDGPLQVQREFGDVGSWPTLPPSGGAAVVGTRLAILDPDLQAPRTTRAAVSLTRALGAGVTLGITGSVRRTEFLVRRRDLNTLQEDVGTDQHGRPVVGDLRIEGGILAADPSTNRRLPGFESVWALDADGWSDYRGVTFSLASGLAEGGSLVAEYTVSKTEDDWFGAGDGRSEAQVPPGLSLQDWEEGTSDFDIPHRLTVAAVVPLPLPAGGTLAGRYRYRSDLPFTPRVAAGLDANGDGSFFNDVAYVPQGTGVEALAAEWGCVEEAIGTFPDRNTCRGSGIHRVDLRLEVGLAMLGDLPARLVLDGLNLTGAESGVRDDALLLVNPGGVVTHHPDGDVSVPYVVNPNFGSLLWRSDPGRMLRVGIRIGGGR